MLWQAPVATRAHGRPTSSEHIAVANGRTKEHTTQEARCNPPIGAGVCGHVPCCFGISPPAAGVAKKSSAHCKKPVCREIRTRGLWVARPAPSPLRYSGVVTVVCFNVPEQRTFISRSRRSVSATCGRNTCDPASSVAPPPPKSPPAPQALPASCRRLFAHLSSLCAVF